VERDTAGLAVLAVVATAACSDRQAAAAQGSGAEGQQDAAEDTIPELSRLSDAEVMTIRKRLIHWKNGRNCLVSSVPVGQRRTVEGRRCYYVWRWTRFHAGVDVSLPIVADFVIDGDTARAELDGMAEMLALQLFGTDRGVMAWQGLI
jgi:hypothetical protein